MLGQRRPRRYLSPIRGTGKPVDLLCSCMWLHVQFLLARNDTTLYRPLLCQDPAKSMPYGGACESRPATNAVQSPSALSTRKLEAAAGGQCIDAGVGEIRARRRQRRGCAELTRSRVSF